jgi:hypothetical protein
LERLQLSSTHSGYVIHNNNPRSTRISSKGGNPLSLSLHPAKRDPTRKFRTSETHATNETMASSQHEKEKMNNDQTRNQEIRDDLHVTANVLLLPTPTKRRFHQSAISLLYKCIPALANSLATPISITNPCMVCGRSMCVTKKR